MRSFFPIAALAAALALLAAPTIAAAGPGTGRAHSHAPDSATLPNPQTSDEQGGSEQTSTSKGKAYGKYCQSQSKKHVKGQKGTPFSRCVNAMAKLAKGKADNPREACKAQSKKHVKGEKGTPFSRCVSAGAKLLDDEAAQNDGADDETSEEQPAS